MVRDLPSVKRSKRDLIRIDPRSDGNYSFAGRNWLYNNISLDGSYFNNSFGLDDPAVGGQTSAEPIPYDAVSEVQVSIAPFDVRQGGFTGANVNTVTKSGTNTWKGSIYTFFRNESLIGNKVDGNEVVANPDLSFNQSGITLGGPIIRDKLFIFANAELERRDDPGTNFVANQGGDVEFGESRVQASVMDQIRQRMRDVYGYETGDYDNFIHETNSDKIIAKLDWNINGSNNLTLRYNFLDAQRDLPPHPFVLSANNSGRGPNETSLPFQNAGYAINNTLNSFALELNSRGSSFANRFFASLNIFRDNRDPFSANFPTIEIAEGGVTYTTIGHEPFSIHNILDQDVLQITNNFTYFTGAHSITAGLNFEKYDFFNSFNIFRHGLFQLPDALDFLCGATFSSLDDFFRRTDPNSDDFYDFNACVTPDYNPSDNSNPFKGENISVSQLSAYLQDEFVVSPTFNLTVGLRVDVPIYNTQPVDNPFSRGLLALDENGNEEVIDQSALPSATPLLAPRIGFNWDASGGARTTQVRGGTGIFTGRVPFVWIGNVVSNPGNNPNLYPNVTPQPDEHQTADDSWLTTSFDLNAFDPDGFKWPQVWTTDLAIDQELGNGFIATIEGIYGKDLNSVYMRNADLVPAVRELPDGRPYYGGAGENENNPDGGAGIYVIDNTDEGYNFNVTAQLRKFFDVGTFTSISYAYTEAKNNLKSTEIASVLWQGQPVKGDPNNPQLSWSEFGPRHRIVATGSHRLNWSPTLGTTIGVFFEVAEGNRFTASGGNRYSFIYAGDVNGDGYSNDLIYIPRSEDEIKLGTVDDAGKFLRDPSQWGALDAFIEQDSYLSSNRGQIADRMGAVTPWFHSLDIRVLQDFVVTAGGQKHTLQLSFDLQNVTNLINSDWGVRQFASAAATSPLELQGFDTAGDPVFQFSGAQQTFVSDPGIFSRWRGQIGVRYILN
jgi:hypothetical protein